VWLNMQKLKRIALGSPLDGEGKSKNVRRLLSLTDRAHRLTLAGDRVTFHVVDSMQVADMIIAFARFNNLEHVVPGAYSGSTMRSILGSLSTKIASEAPCRVTVVTARKQG
jgi:eukaryotic-like serine/threonine-protein kinase